MVSGFKGNFVLFSYQLFIDGAQNAPAGAEETEEAEGAEDFFEAQKEANDFEENGSSVSVVKSVSGFYFEFY